MKRERDRIPRGRNADSLYGVHPVLEALRSTSRSFNKIFVARDQRGKEVQEILEQCKAQRIPIHFEERKILTRLAGHEKHQGIVAVTSAKPYAQVEEILDLAKKMIAIAYLIIGVVYMLTAAAGYAGFGNDVANNVLDNLDQGSVLVKCALAFITLQSVQRHQQKVFSDAQPVFACC